MQKIKFLAGLLVILLAGVQCHGKTNTENPASPPQKNRPVPGAERLDVLLPLLGKKRVALVVNHTSLVGKTHLLDTLLARGVRVQKIFAPEHGFRGTADAGEHIRDGVDTKTGLPLISLYGKNQKPLPGQLEDVDIVIFDIQDVGVRCYTYISTMHLVMEACAEQGKKVIVLDRPNPNGHYIDGPVLHPDFRSFVGMHPIPLVHGLTVGELAQMINGERWLENGLTCELEVVPVLHWTHQDPYSPPVKPSPNLPNDQAIKLYPTLVLFEGTVISVGRGTDKPFQVIGHPDMKLLRYQFTPRSTDGAKNPPYENKTCYGLDLSKITLEPRLWLNILTDMYAAYPDKSNFFNKSFFDKLAGTSVLREQIQKEVTIEGMQQTWEEDLQAYKKMREKYLLYP